MRMRPLIRGIFLVVGAVYLVLSLPLVLLLLRSEYFRIATASEVTRKLSHLRPMEVVFCGDSITATITDWGGRLGLRPFSVLNLGIPGLYVGQVRDQVQRALLLHTGRIVVMAGTNDLRDPRRTDEAIIEDWETILQLKAGSDPPRLIVVSIPLQGDSRLDERTHALNRQLAVAAERARWEFLDLNARFAAANGPRSNLFTDGVHFSESAYRLWIEELARIVKVPVGRVPE